MQGHCKGNQNLYRLNTCGIQASTQPHIGGVPSGVPFLQQINRPLRKPQGRESTLRGTHALQSLNLLSVKVLLEIFLLHECSDILQLQL
jgi:hypothetical protein